MGAVLAFEGARELGKMIQEAVTGKTSEENGRKIKAILQIGIICVSWSVGNIAFNKEGNNFLDSSEAALCYIVAILEGLILVPIFIGASKDDINKFMLVECLIYIVPYGLIFFGFLTYHINDLSTFDQWIGVISFLLIPILGFDSLYDHNADELADNLKSGAKNL